MRVEEAVIIRILNLCDDNNMTINRLATESAVHPSTLKNIVYGNSRNTGISTIAKLCDGMGITVKEFFSNELFEQLEQEIY